jgi:translocation and assembly module TamA
LARHHVNSVRSWVAHAIVVALIAAPWVPPARADSIEYETKFVGATEEMLDALRDASQLVALADKQPTSQGALRRRAKADLDRLAAVLRSEGYYEAALQYQIDTEAKPETVTVTIEPGEIYTLAAISLVTLQGGSVPDIGDLVSSSYGLLRGTPATAAAVLAAEGLIAASYRHEGYPFAKVAEHHAVVDSATRMMEVTYVVDAGAKARFGETRIDGLTGLDRRYVADRIGWTEGEIYDQTQVDATRRTLVSSGLFGAVSIEPVGPVVDGAVPVRVKLTERLRHSLAVGAAYNTVEGISGTLSWEDRNIFGHAEDLMVTGRAGTTTDGLVAKFRRPDILGYNVDLLSDITVEQLMDPAFDSVHELGSVGFEQHFEPKLIGDISLQAEHARLNEKTDFRVYTLVGLPVSLRWDGTDDLLNPTGGERAGGILTPYLRALGGNDSFTQAKFDGSLYRRLTDSDRYILALEGTIGTTIGSNLDDIPKDHRFYTGGGGSVRGFGFQKGGPLDQFFNPIGGRSVLETSAELRVKLTDTIGLVPFLDAGSDYETVLPRLDAKPAVGAGLGLRYYTPIGPVRLDIATPLDPHREGDSPVQIYVSLGQAF